MVKEKGTKGQIIIYKTMHMLNIHVLCYLVSIQFQNSKFKMFIG